METGNLPPRCRLAQWLLPGGSEPDPRFTLANERTFLAWIRTALALLASGIAVEAFTAGLFAPLFRQFLACGLILLALVVSMAAGQRWLQVERALRLQQPLPCPLLIPLLVVGTALAVLLGLLFLLLPRS